MRSVGTAVGTVELRDHLPEPAERIGPVGVVGLLGLATVLLNFNNFSLFAMSKYLVLFLQASSHVLSSGSVLSRQSIVLRRIAPFGMPEMYTSSICSSSGAISQASLPLLSQGTQVCVGVSSTPMALDDAVVAVNAVSLFAYAVKPSDTKV